ncbi:16S rRNA (cytosine(1402)-N(4))-methyltransferase RsmH [Niveispirillum sp. BGYR6]|uniref:16S rRNA (cytosine(1402)-N(4))-methyltransferase RsmH n=1 Tax=Niveispirillum sp. BGYR6 TaxID=2971249 RepID=UPI0022B9B3A2|nr:16S rRNA (cytosine(1402)-N(4))-methyltransferase RsmH [Niveispirillum sp. BGYR6]MDG5494964.1 16S rRNA (cytosine(1402)-N(4))-methyltransferase RsmH [Niveispirillum sp. BGYR6]
MTASPVHIPVLLAEVLHEMAPRAGEVLVDGTFGAGGYSRALLDSAACTVWGIDRDPAALERARPLEAAYAGRLKVLEGRFGDMADLLAARGVAQVDAIVLDIGVSSPQIDTPERGFSFRFDGPLDMRMGADGPTAADVVNSTEEDDLANILYHYGEERLSRRVARAIVARRAIEPFTRTADLADVIRSCVPKSKDGIDPATRSFQGLRIHVNDELGELERALAAAERLLAPGGRLCVVTFHSLEDRVVKEFMRQRSGNLPGPSRHVPGPVATPPAPTFRLLSKSGTGPGAAEQAANPRARSARLRTAIRTQAPAWSTGESA